MGSFDQHLLRMEGGKFWQSVKIGKNLLKMPIRLEFIFIYLFTCIQIIEIVSFLRGNYFTEELLFEDVDAVPRRSGN